MDCIIIEHLTARFKRQKACTISRSHPPSILYTCLRNKPYLPGHLENLTAWGVWVEEFTCGYHVRKVGLCAGCGGKLKAWRCGLVFQESVRSLPHGTPAVERPPPPVVRERTRKYIPFFDRTGIETIPPRPNPATQPRPRDNDNTLLRDISGASCGFATCAPPARTRVSAALQARVASSQSTRCVWRPFQAPFATAVLVQPRTIPIPSSGRRQSYPRLMGNRGARARLLS